MKKLKTASFFAGVGGIDLGFKNISKIIYANELNKNSVITYEKNFDIKVDHQDIRDIKPTNLPEFDLMLAGFPCQAFSLAGYRKGFEDDKGRGTLFFELVKILKLKKPDIVFLENVKNLVSHDSGKTFQTILKELSKLDYYVKYKVLNAKDYGNSPQNRERIYVVAFRNKQTFEKFVFPNPVPLKKQIENILTKDIVDSKFYYTAEKYKFHSLLEESINKKNTIYQWRRKYVRENKSNVCPTLTANMGTGGHNVPLILTDHGIRKLTPRECFLFQGFPEKFILPDIANSHLYKQAGNSVCVSVISRIAKNIETALTSK